MSRSERDQLTHWRNINARRSVDICSIAPRVLKAGGLGDEEWSVREQLAFAALDMGAMGLAEVSSSAATRFPCSKTTVNKVWSGMRQGKPAEVIVANTNAQTQVSEITSCNDIGRDAFGDTG